MKKIKILELKGRANAVLIHCPTKRYRTTLIAFIMALDAMAMFRGKKKVKGMK